MHYKICPKNVSRIKLWKLYIVPNMQWHFLHFNHFIQILWIYYIIDLQNIPKCVIFRRKLFVIFRRIVFVIFKPDFLIYFCSSSSNINLMPRLMSVQSSLWEFLQIALWKGMSNKKLSTHLLILCEKLYTEL